MESLSTREYRGMSVLLCKNGHSNHLVAVAFVLSCGADSHLRHTVVMACAVAPLHGP